MRQALTWMSVWAATALCGCASRGNVDLLESQLRVQEDRIHALQRDLKTAGSELAAARRETESLRTQVSEKSAVVAAPEESRALSRVESIQIHKLLTGGLDTDGKPGHDEVSTVIIPVDASGELVKVPGTLRVELLDLGSDGTQRQVGVWEFPADEAERHWKRNFVGSGYAVRAPLGASAQSDRLTLHARLTTTDGRQFDATHQFVIDRKGESNLARGGRQRPARVATKNVTNASPREAAAPARPPDTAGKAGAPLLTPPSAGNAEPPPFPAEGSAPRPMPAQDDPKQDDPKDGSTSRSEPPVPGPFDVEEPDPDLEPPARIRLTGTSEPVRDRAKEPAEFPIDREWPLPVKGDATEPSAPSPRRARSSDGPPRPNAAPRDSSPHEKPRRSRRQAAPLPPPSDFEPPFDDDPQTPQITSDRWTDFDRPVLR